MHRLLPLLLIPGFILGQSLRARNVLDYRGAIEGHSHFEDRAWMALDFGDFSGGLLFWAQEPPRFDTTSTDTTAARLAQYWFSFYSQKFELTAGSFTQILGQGIILDLYERHDIQIDHHCDGANFIMRLPYIEAQGFNGIARWDNNSIVRGGAFTLIPWRTRIGMEYAKIMPKEPSYPQELWGTYFSADLDFFSLWAEYGHKQPIGGLTEEGNAYYASVAAILDRFALTFEYKDYSEFAVRTPAVQYNNPPTLVREPYYTLPSRHLHELNSNDEVGYAAIFDGKIWRLTGEVFYAHAENHDGEKAFNQIWAEMEYRNDDETFAAKIVNEYRTENEENIITPIMDILWEPVWTLFAFNAIGEFQKTDDVNNAYGSFSVTYPPFATVGIEGGRIDDEDFIRSFADLDVIERTKIRLGFGKRPGGFTCSGGQCRYEEAFEGVELQLVITY